MPKPGHVIVAQNCSINPQTNQINYYNAVNGFFVRPFGPNTDAGESSGPVPGGEIMPVSIVVTWIKDNNDTPDVRFESRITCRSEANETLFESGVIAFSFSNHFQRLISSNVIIPAFPSLGIYTIEATLNRVGNREIIARQMYCFTVILAPSPPIAGAYPAVQTI